MPKQTRELAASSQVPDGWPMPGLRSVAKHYTYYRPAILALLKERASHGYELASRIADFGFDHRLTASLYGALRDMEGEGLITSSWDLSRRGGPPRRVYAVTAAGEGALNDAVPLLVRQRRALDAVLDLCERLERQDETVSTSSGRAKQARAKLA